MRCAKQFGRKFISKNSCGAPIYERIILEGRSGTLLLRHLMEHLRALIISYIDCAESFGTRGLLCRISCMDGSTAYMASNIARAVRIRRGSQIRTRVATDFFLVQL